MEPTERFELSTRGLRIVYSLSHAVKPHRRRNVPEPSGSCSGRGTCVASDERQMSNKGAPSKKKEKKENEKRNVWTQTQLGQSRTGSERTRFEPAAGSASPLFFYAPSPSYWRERVTYRACRGT